MSGIPLFKAILENRLSIFFKPTAAIVTAPGRTRSSNGRRVSSVRAFVAQVSPARRHNWMLALLPLLLAGTGAQAQAVFATPIAVGGTTEQTVSVTSPAGGTVASVAVLTMGVPNLDFQTGKIIAVAHLIQSTTVRTTTPSKVRSHGRRIELI